MTRKDIVNQIAKETGLKRKDVREVVEVFIGTVKDSLTKGETVYFRRFGSFSAKRRAQKSGYNFTENISFVVPAHYIPHFKPSESFSATVKKNIKKAI